MFDEELDAIIGLSYPIPGKFNEKGLMDKIMEEKLLVNNLFAFFLSVNQYEDSEITFGWYDTSKFYGSLSWYPVMNKLYWSVKLDDVKVKIKLTIAFNNYS